MNIYEEARRLKKVAQVIGAIDVAMWRLGLDPRSKTALEAVSGFDDEGWTMAAGAAEVRECSETTRVMVIDAYQKRCVS